MDLTFLARREGVTINRIAEVAGVDHSTAWRWVSRGDDCDRVSVISRLHAHGILTDADLRAGGFAIGLPVAAPAPADEPVAEVDPADVTP
jgi:hypothetical protein